jgi:hypothetical protein
MTFESKDISFSLPVLTYFALKMVLVKNTGSWRASGRGTCKFVISANFQAGSCSNYAIRGNGNPLIKGGAIWVLHLVAFNFGCLGLCQIESRSCGMCENFRVRMLNRSIVEFPSKCHALRHGITHLILIHLRVSARNGFRKGKRLYSTA